MRNIIHLLSNNKSNCIDQNIYSRLLPADKNKKTQDASYYTWGGSVVKYEGTYYMAVCRWTKSGDFLDWPLNSVIVLATSKDLEGPYTGFTEILETKGESWSQTAAFNPRFYVYNNIYYLFFTGTSGVTRDEAVENQRIGIVYTADFITWNYASNPLIQPRPGMWDSFFINNPAAYRSTDGKFSMIYKSRTSILDPFKLGIAQSDDILSGWSSISDIPILNGERLEDQNVWFEGCKFYLIARGFGAGENGLLYESTDGLNWVDSIHHEVFDFTINWNDGTSDNYVRIEGPFIYHENNIAKALFVACYDGSNSFNICRLLSNAS